MEPLPESCANSDLGCSENVLNVNLSALKPRRVVEVYVQRSLSLREGNANSKKAKWRSLQGSISFKEGSGRTDPGIHCSGQDKQQTVRENQKHGDEVVPSRGIESGVEKAVSKSKSKEGKKGKRSQTFFGKIASFLWKKKGDEKKGDGHKRLKEPGSPQVEWPPEHSEHQHLASNYEPPREVATVHKFKKRNSLRKVFSLKRNNSEAKDIGSGGPGSSKNKVVRPTLLDLKGGCAPRQSKTERDSEYLYEQVSEEVERIMRTLESSEGNEAKLQGRKVEEAQSWEKPADDNVLKIIEILKNVGDHIDSVLQENSQLSTFFRNISYDAFKELADQYIKKEVWNKGPQENPELMKLAFTLDFTAKVAGICNHQVKRITGFGSQYLQDTCWQLLSFSNQQETVNNAEGASSPD
ncbi:apoptosis facilitator Bcl-2-like protein 14 [Narcine bancroftii]|uniref:apoptosis facilitator Bcl-2-like protein 14 n=1 Tax=Narcine bancroftii TaxID=1343680 RepID=UPI0038310EB0